jgi:hypothetical protein
MNCRTVLPFLVAFWRKLNADLFANGKVPWGQNQLGDYAVNQALTATLMRDTLWSKARRANMNGPLTYPDQLRDDNLVQFFSKLLGEFVKKFVNAVLEWLVHALPWLAALWRGWPRLAAPTFPVDPVNQDLGKFIVGSTKKI